MAEADPQAVYDVGGRNDPSDAVEVLMVRVPGLAAPAAEGRRCSSPLCWRFAPEAAAEFVFEQKAAEYSSELFKYGRLLVMRFTSALDRPCLDTMCSRML